MSILLKYILIFLSGGSAVTAVSYISQKGLPLIAGIVIFIPVVSIASYIFVGHFQGNDVLQSLVIRTFYAFPALIAFLITLYFLLSHFNYTIALSLSFFMWALVAALTLLIGNKIYE